ncbi:MAG: hypothetical protein J6S40_03340 [Thermoguttaceae bacterium]|nr:hypothetical protein [Thermoguttaceae bacterium]
MSNSGSNTWTIVGLVFFVLALALGISEYFTAMALYSAKVQTHDYGTLSSQLNSENNRLTGDADTLKNLIGVGGDSSDAVVAAASETLKNVAGDQSETPKSCLMVIEGLVQNLTGKDRQLEKATKDRDSYKLIADMETEKADTQKETFDTKTDDLNNTNDKRQEDAENRYKDLQAQKAELEKTVAEVKADDNALIDKLETQTADAEESVKMIAGINASLRDRIERLTDPLTEIPDGKIVYVDQLNRVVWLNIGEADGVRLLTTFGVYSKDALADGALESKGSLEVIRIVDAHECEARILNDEMEDPFVPGDYIFTPLWKSGEQVKVALDYFLDVDGDNKDDLDLLVNLINQSGSSVSAWIDKDGEIRGKIEPDVNYIIMSNTPIMTIIDSDPDMSDEMKNKIRDAHMHLLDDADKKGVPRISLAQFLHETHYKQSARVSRYQEPGGVKQTDRGGIPIVSHANIAPIYDKNTKDAKVNSFGVTAPIYNPRRVDNPGPSSGKVSDAYFHRRSNKNL